ncbi:hypothetical protein BDY19DRAFT_902342 [Irpex rosettiformis]|uniref:Uncharacterized protein n=1 Tax=Irpex rosettiformis TaxID=378272 RepID=A0ACB8UGT5_9APHY|nr:hypothetical protein BDY19DRAFT_902342 [Irpex rosettiformis]
MLVQVIAIQAAKCCSPIQAIAAHYLYLYCRFWLRAFLSLTASVEDVLTTVFEWESRILSVPACGVNAPRESAIVIIGGEAGLGQAISLRLSELGYTVFALCPNLPGTCSATDQATKSSAVSSLLYAWHKRKERSTHTSWGLVAPISCDMSSGAQRTHAFETVQAYCVRHSLNLTALVAIYPSSPAKRKDVRHEVTDSRAQKFELRDVLSSPLWTSPNQLSLIETVHVVEDYVGMLSKTSGRVIMLAHGERECYFCRPVALLGGVGQQITRNLNACLETVGIRAIFVSVGPIAASVEEEPNEVW